MKHILYFLPRVLSLLLVLFFGIFILEGFDTGFGWGAALSHLLQTLIVLGITVVAWKWPKIGGWIFLALGVFFSVFFRPFWWNGLVFGGAVLLMGVLFLVSRPLRK